MLTAIACFAYPDLLHANNYKCSDEQGAISYSDKACSSGHKQLAKMYSPEPARVITSTTGTVITLEELHGKWTDAPGGTFNSSWYFSGFTVTYANKQGVTMKERYTLDKDQLIFHHKPGLWGDEGWKESVTILQYTGQTLVLKWGVAKVVLYRG